MKKIIFYTTFFFISIFFYACINDDDFKESKVKYFTCPSGVNGGGALGTVGDTIFLEIEFETEVLPDFKKITFYTTAGEFLSGSISSGKDSSEVLVFSDNSLNAKAQLVLTNAGSKLFGYTYDYKNSSVISEDFCTVASKNSSTTVTIDTVEFLTCEMNNLEVSETIFFEIIASGDVDKIHGTQVEFTTNAGRFVENVIDPSAVVDTINIQFIDSLARTQLQLKDEPGEYFFRYRFMKDSILYLDECYLEIN